MKERGILLPIYSLPSQYGIGDFGNEAYEFIDILSENGIKYWQILPINACDRLPYSPISYYALEEDYISLDKLKEAKLETGFTTKVPMFVNEGDVIRVDTRTGEYMERI